MWWMKITPYKTKLPKWEKFSSLSNCITDPNDDPPIQKSTLWQKTHALLTTSEIASLPLQNRKH